MITEFSGDHRFLSNFYASPISVTLASGEVDIYPTAEHLFQSYKTADTEWQRRIREARTPGEAKRLGRRAPLRDDWDLMRNGYMWAVLAMKFAQHPDLAALLVATGDEELVEGNTWGDTYWGVCRGTGENRLGQLLMQLRLLFRNSIVVVKHREGEEGSDEALQVVTTNQPDGEGFSQGL